ncbi:hypothetical protein [Niveibacterium terrae]|uniref:hypothetical protein n=1 Tax=Niveibacterium terrae TaxID=3373598 RepID=UPI003A948DFD
MAKAKGFTFTASIPLHVAVWLHLSQARGVQSRLLTALSDAAQQLRSPGKVIDKNQHFCYVSTTKGHSSPAQSSIPTTIH